MTAADISEHGAKIAAGRLGISVEEYRRLRADGLKWCPECVRWRPAIGHPYCRDCKRAYERENGHRIHHVRGARS